MKSKKTVLMILLAFVLVLGGASVLYNRLGENLAPEQLAEQAPQASEPYLIIQLVPGNLNRKKCLHRILPCMIWRGMRYICRTSSGNPSF